MAISVHGSDDTISITIDDGEFIEFSIECSGIMDECKAILDTKDIRKLKTIAKLKSKKSWTRLIKSGNLELINVEDRTNIKILTFIICYSVDNKLINNSRGSEIFRMSKE
jgi:hypothetical protein